jgi:hypothetical protein
VKAHGSAATVYDTSLAGASVGRPTAPRNSRPKSRRWLSRPGGISGGVGRLCLLTRVGRGPGQPSTRAVDTSTYMPGRGIVSYRFISMVSAAKGNDPFSLSGCSCGETRARCCLVFGAVPSCFSHLLAGVANLKVTFIINRMSKQQRNMHGSMASEGASYLFQATSAVELRGSTC